MRDGIAAAVRSISPLDEPEREHISGALEWIASGKPLCRIEKPATPPMHLVSYFVVVDPLRGLILLTDHIKSGLWLPTGGQVEPGEDPRDTVRRESAEELNLEASFLVPDPIFITITETVGSTAGHTDVSLWYLLTGDGSLAIDFDPGEFHSVRWFPLDELPLHRSDPHIERFVRKLLSLLHPPALRISDRAGDVAS